MLKILLIVTLALTLGACGAPINSDINAASYSDMYLRELNRALEIQNGKSSSIFRD